MDKNQIKQRIGHLLVLIAAGAEYSPRKMEEKVGQTILPIKDLDEKFEQIVSTLNENDEEALEKDFIEWLDTQVKEVVSLVNQLSDGE